MCIGKDMKNFDFLVIGTMKSGTTSVHDILSKDPRIVLPLGKETPFFTDEDKMNLGLESFFSRYYPKKLEGKCIGKVSPQYMAWYDTAAMNISKFSPNTKLIAILRDPIDRLLSQYSMSVGMGLEKRNLNEAISDCLNNPSPSFDAITNINSYVLWSSYGMLLTKYMQENNKFKENFLILGFDKVVKDQKTLISKIYKHIGLNIPKNNSENIHSLARGGGGSCFSRLMVQLPWMVKGIVKFLPHKYKDVVRMANIEAQVSMYAPKVLRKDLNQVNIIALKNIFNEDKKILKEIGFNPYWKN